MGETFFFIVYCCSVGMMTLIGLLMLISPERAIRVIFFSMRNRPWFDGNPQWSPGARFELRIAGFIGAVLSAYMLVAPLYYRLKRETVKPTTLPVERLPAEMQPSGLQWWTQLGLLCFLLLVGAYCLIRPRNVLTYFLKKIPYLRVPNDFPQSSFLPVRIIGGFMICFAFYELARMFHP